MGWFVKNADFRIDLIYGGHLMAPLVNNKDGPLTKTTDIRTETLARFTVYLLLN